MNDCSPKLLVGAALVVVVVVGGGVTRPFVK